MIKCFVLQNKIDTSFNFTSKMSFLGKLSAALLRQVIYVVCYTLPEVWSTAWPATPPLININKPTRLAPIGKEQAALSASSMCLLRRKLIYEMNKS